ncbi:hypothetical protein ZWY2020_038436 [Hordeum vulgare]|nr:hypothetical protein ZWY2020_038436 [Hordeum vulgare]
MPRLGGLAGTRLIKGSPHPHPYRPVPVSGAALRQSVWAWPPSSSSRPSIDGARFVDKAKGLDWRTKPQRCTPWTRARATAFVEPRHTKFRDCGHGLTPRGGEKRDAVVFTDACAGSGIDGALFCSSCE